MTALDAGLAFLAVAWIAAAVYVIRSSHHHHHRHDRISTELHDLQKAMSRIRHPSNEDR